jgi:hypothetical protein
MGLFSNTVRLDYVPGAIQAMASPIIGVVPYNNGTMVLIAVDPSADVERLRAHWTEMLGDGVVEVLIVTPDQEFGYRAL